MKDTSDLFRLIHQFKEITPPVNSFEIKKKNILAFMNMKESMADEYLNDLIDVLIAFCKKICEPKACYTYLNNLLFDIDKGTMDMGSQNFDTGKTIASYFKKSSLIAIFICTCGEKVEKYSRELMQKGDSLEGFIVDLIGSEIAEEIADYLHKKIESEVLEYNLKVSNRYSPGYCNWPVTDQQSIFALFNENTCGIHLTPSSLMIPIKSVSGIIGIGDDIKQVAYKCKLCDDKNCILRQRQ